MSSHLDTPVKRSVQTKNTPKFSDSITYDDNFIISKRTRNSHRDSSSALSKQRRQDSSMKFPPKLHYPLDCCARNTHIFNIPIRQLTRLIFHAIISEMQKHFYIYILNGEEWGDDFLPQKNRWKIECVFYPNVLRTNFVINFARLEEELNDRNVVEIQCMRGNKAEFQRLCAQMKKHLHNVLEEPQNLFSLLEDLGQIYLPSQPIAITNASLDQSTVDDQTSPETVVKESYSQFLAIVFNMICSSIFSTALQGWYELAKLTSESSAVANHLLSSKCQMSDNEPALSHITKILQRSESDDDEIRCVLVCLTNALNARQNITFDVLQQIVSSMSNMLHIFGNECSNNHSLETRYRYALLVHKLLSNLQTKKLIFGSTKLLQFLFEYQSKLEKYANKDELEVKRLQSKLAEREMTTTKIGSEAKMTKTPKKMSKRRFETIASCTLKILEEESASIAKNKIYTTSQREWLKANCLANSHIQTGIESLTLTTSTSTCVDRRSDKKHMQIPIGYNDHTCSATSGTSDPVKKL